jgi:hypothetical protein
MTILNTIEVVAKSNALWVDISAAVLLISFILFLIFAAKGKETASAVCGIAVLVSMLSAGIGVATSHKYKTGEIRLEVTLDESVPARDIFEGYELIERRGEIYVLKPLDGGEAE